MKKLITIILLSISFCVFSQSNQQVNFGNNTPFNRSEWFIPNSPTNTVGNRTVTGWIKAYDVFHMEMDTIRFTKLHSGINKGLPNGVVWADSNGNLKYSPMSEFRLPASQVTSTNTAYNKNFGSTSNTIAEGNDARIINGQTAFGWGNHTGLYASLSVSYNNPPWIASLDYSKLTGVPSSTPEIDPLFNTKFSSKTTDDLTEGIVRKYDKTVTLTQGNRI